jgi:hypothetical protein
MLNFKIIYKKGKEKYRHVHLYVRQLQMDYIHRQKNTKVKREQATKIMLEHVQQKNMKQKKKKKEQRT